MVEVEIMNPQKALKPTWKIWILKQLSRQDKHEKISDGDLKQKKYNEWEQLLEEKRTKIKNGLLLPDALQGHRTKCNWK